MSGTIFHDDVPFGGATSVDTLVDVNLGENGPSNGDILVYDESTGMWKPSGNLNTLNSKIDHGSVSANLSNNTYSTAITALKNAGYDATKLTINSKIIFYYNSVKSTIYTINNIENQWFQSVTTTGSGTSCITLRMTDSKAYQSLGSTFADISTETLINVNKIEIVY